MSAIEFPAAVQALVESLKTLPGIGSRSAERIAIWLLQHPKADPRRLAADLVAARDGVVLCDTCGFFATAEHCTACGQPNREPKLCIVEQPTDVLPMERAGVFRGRYHCLGGRLSPLDQVGPEDLRLANLVQRVGGGRCDEVILALGADVEGEATASYLTDLLAGHCRVSRLAQGLPVGGGLEYADALTLARAFEGRR
jgi:recombination protein RecR